MIWRLPILFLALLATTAHAQVRPQPGPGDPRIQTVDYLPDQVILIEGAPGYQVAIELAPDEQIQSIALGDSSAWQASTGKGGSRLYITPSGSGVSTNMTVITDARTYRFELGTADGGMGPAPYEVRFRYPGKPDYNGPAQMQEPGADAVIGLYRLKGDKSLYPLRMSDDGSKTIIDWSPDVALPAIFVIDEHGRELVANGNMRSGVYVIDSVYQRLLFRIDRHLVHADRYLPKKPKP
ncbi:TrbG/VirB9 family P-type conjugative transfer protein [Sphingobium fuliginis]|uniref:Type VI secretion protein n=1 Tax=Sphingobium fuliginis ATCC 27551 TaxID=1208342 RepID=A0A5B8CAZ2_SPHSA|nr:TrbG/VirB9 family P-type conjugative transfer protein [Sphingobium fuliginis]QDC36369.1 type VI secretion protein [Sphingobium fuliginis ATCC 27551]